MGDLGPALVTVGVGLVLLVILVLLTLRPVRRFARARSELRDSITRRTEVLRALANRRRGSAEQQLTGPAASRRTRGRPSGRRRLSAT